MSNDDYRRFTEKICTLTYFTPLFMISGFNPFFNFRFKNFISFSSIRIRQDILSWNFISFFVRNPVSKMTKLVCSNIYYLIFKSGRQITIIYKPNNMGIITWPTLFFYFSEFLLLFLSWIFVCHGYF